MSLWRQQPDYVNHYRPRGRWVPTVPPAGGVVINRTLSESVDAVDGFADWRERNRQVVDSAVVTDGASRVAQMFRLRSDNVDATDSLARLRVCLRGLADAVDTGDSATPYRERFRLLADAVAVSDALIVSIQRGANLIITRTLSDAVDVEDLRYKILSRLARGESVEAYDQGYAFKELTRKALDAVAVIDSLARAAQRNRLLPEQVQAVDALLRQAFLVRVLTDAVAVVDSDSVSIMRLVRDVIHFILTGIGEENIEAVIGAEPIKTAVVLAQNIEVDIR